MLYNVGNSILAFTPQVNSRKLIKNKNTSNYSTSKKMNVTEVISGNFLVSAQNYLPSIGY